MWAHEEQNPEHSIPQPCVKQVERQNHQKQIAALLHEWIFSAKNIICKMKH